MLGEGGGVGDPGTRTQKERSATDLSFYAGDTELNRSSETPSLLHSFPPFHHSRCFHPKNRERPEAFVLELVRMVVYNGGYAKSDF